MCKIALKELMSVIIDAKVALLTADNVTTEPLAPLATHRQWL